jgi:GNAT superfamily N-acetyltransferase
MTPGIEIRVDPYPDRPSFADLSVAAWGTPWDETYDLDNVLRRSLVHLGAYRDGRLVGYVNVAWDGAMHAFLLDPMVHPDVRRDGLGSVLVKRATELARERGATYLHVDYEPHLATFYERCGFRPTAAGFIRL